MTDQQLQQLQDCIREMTLQVQKDPELGTKFLREAGILDANGRLEPRYAGIVDLMRSGSKAEHD